ncbi:MAG: NAD(+) synthase [Clostridia bacterium]|nr:NAD(+) synthase [Clostridia bacterium]
MKSFIITEKNAEEYVQKIARWIKNKVNLANMKGVVLGMSGGIDCSVVARLCQVAGVKTHLILMPYGEDMKNCKSKNHAMELINKFDFSYSIFDIKTAVDSLEIGVEEKSTSTELAKANLRPRVRMTYLYEYAQINSFFVIGTGNLDERLIGYFTKWGDGACDLNPIGNLTKGEVYTLARCLGVPESIINKKPSAGLWEGQTDEDELGMGYDQIDRFIIDGTSGNIGVDEVIKKRIEMSKHKINPVSIFE